MPPHCKNENFSESASRKMLEKTPLGKVDVTAEAFTVSGRYARAPLLNDFEISRTISALP